MTALPITPFILRGGCFCNAVSYTISVPILASRPLIPNPPRHPLGPQNEVSKHLPIISLDHCNSCRRISGAVIQCWFICPQSWISFSLLSRSKNSTDDAEARISPATALEVLRPGTGLLETTYLSYFSSSKDVHRTFCGKCGTHLTFHYSGGDDEMAAEDKFGPHFDITLGTLDSESAEMEGVRPGRQGWCEDGIGWVKQMVGGSVGNVRYPS
jgi:hypothetical protein